MQYLLFFFLIIRRPPRSTLFPSTPLFQSRHRLHVAGDGRVTARIEQQRLLEELLGLRIGGALILGEQLRAVLEPRSEEHTSELQSQSNLVCRLLLEKKNQSRDRPFARHTW